MKKLELTQPAIIGVGRTKFGEHYEINPEKLVEEAGLQALDAAGIERKDVDACYFSDYFLQITNKIGIEEGFLSELLELHIPMERLRSFSSALLNASLGVRSGKYGVVLVGGVEKMTDRWDKIRDDLMLLEDPWSYYAGCTPEANHELLLREYIKRYEISGNQLEKLNMALAQISVKNHHHAMKNEYAQYRREISIDSVLKKRIKTKGLGLYDFAPISDGASALILASPEIAKNYPDTLVSILGSSSATDYITFASREDRTGFIASNLAMESALKMAKIKAANDIQIVEVYDQSTLLEMLSLEDLCFSKRGRAWLDVYKSCKEYQGFYEIEGKEIFVNRNGGLKADGNPLGATGGAQVFEVVKQINGEAKDRQVEVNGDPPRLGCVLELEGFGTKAYVHILGRETI